VSGREDKKKGRFSQGDPHLFSKCLKKQVKQKLMIAKNSGPLHQQNEQREGIVRRYQNHVTKSISRATLWVSRIAPKNVSKGKFQKPGEEAKTWGGRGSWPDTQNPKIVNQKLKEKTATNPRHSSLQKF